MFYSTSIAMHLLRGVGAAALLALALVVDGMPWPIRTVALGGAFVLMRGCPACWLIGRIESVGLAGVPVSSTRLRGDA